MDVERPQRVCVVGGHEDDERQVLRGERLEDLEAVDARHLDVEEHEVGPQAPDGAAASARRRPRRRSRRPAAAPAAGARPRGPAARRRRRGRGAGARRQPASGPAARCSGSVDAPRAAARGAGRHGVILAIELRQAGPGVGQADAAAVGRRGPEPGPVSVTFRASASPRAARQSGPGRRPPPS